MLQDYDKVKDFGNASVTGSNYLPVLDMDSPISEEAASSVKDFLTKNGFMQFEPAIVVAINMSHGPYDGFSVDLSNRFLEDVLRLNANETISEEQLSSFREKYHISDEFVPKYAVSIDKETGGFLCMETESYPDSQMKHQSATPSEAAKAYVSDAIRGRNHLVEADRLQQEIAKNLPLLACRELGTVCDARKKNVISPLQTALEKAFVARTSNLFPDIKNHEDIFFHNMKRALHQCQALRKAIQHVSHNPIQEDGWDLAKAFDTVALGFNYNCSEAAAINTSDLMKELSTIRLDEVSDKNFAKILDALARFDMNYRGGNPSYDAARANKQEFFDSYEFRNHVAKLQLVDSVKFLADKSMTPKEVVKLAKDTAKQIDEQQKAFMAEIPF